MKIRITTSAIRSVAGRVASALAVGCFAAVMSTPARSAELPLWEIGLGPSVISVPYYRGSADNNTLVLPFIYPVYRGDRLRVDNRGIRGKIFQSDRVRLDVSADANSPGKTDDIQGREGMPDLDPTIQIGPSAQIRLWEKPGGSQTLTLNLPLRGVFALNSGLDDIGYTFTPHVTWNRNVELFARKWRLGVSAGLHLGSGDYHDYY